MSESAYRPVRFDLEKNYEEFIRVHGFDIRAPLTLVHSTVPNLRDNRDPQAIGRALLQRPKNMSILEMAALIEETRV